MVQQEQWQKHHTPGELDSGSSFEGGGRTATAPQSESSYSGIGEAQLLEHPVASAASHSEAPGSAEPQEASAGSTNTACRSFAVGCAVTMAVVLAAVAGYVTLASTGYVTLASTKGTWATTSWAGTSASQLHLPQVPFLGAATPKEQLLSAKDEQMPDTSSGCCRGPQARCRACEASLSVAEYCRRQHRPVHVAGCEQFEGDGASLHSSEERKKEEADVEKVPQVQQHVKHSLPQRQPPVHPESAPEPLLPTSGPMLAGGGNGKRCCTEETARCVACNVGMSVVEYCSRTDALKVSGCDEVRHPNEQHSSTSSPNARESHEEKLDGDEEKHIIEQRKAAMIAKLKAQFAAERRKEERHEMERQQQLEHKEDKELQRLEHSYNHNGSAEASTSNAGSVAKTTTTSSTSSSSSTKTTTTKTTTTMEVKVVVAPPSSTHATRSTSHEAVPQVVVEKAKSLPTLFCFSLMLPWGYEPHLLKMQLLRGRSIFACDATEVYSSEEMDLGGLVTVDLGIDLHCHKGGVFHTVMNTPIFLHVWKRLIIAGRFRQYEWTVKADPDAVFFPQRLRHILEGTDQAKATVGKGIFLNNCGFGLHGPLEVVSNRALEAYGEGHSGCKRPPQEDVYLQQCLIQLGVTQVNHFNLLAEDHCAFKEWEECKSGHVAFHPFKKVEEYERCLDVVEGPVVS